MRPDDNVLGIFKNYYERSSDAGGPLHRDLEKWFDLLSTRLRLELRLRWLRAIPAKVDPAELVKELEAVLSNFTQAGQFTSLEDARPPTSEALGDDLKRLTHEIQVAEADLPSSSDAPYTSQQAALLHLALLHEPIRYNQPTLPLPAFAPLSGMGGLSAVLFLPTDQGNGLVVAAKFDAPERSTKEWEQVNQLRDLDLPDEFVLPLRCSQRGDGVILSQAALNTDSLCTPLGGYLADCLPRAVEACCACLSSLAGSLAKLHRHQPGRFTEPNPPERGQWRAFALVGDVMDDWKDRVRPRALEFGGLRNATSEIADPRGKGRDSLPNPLGLKVDPTDKEDLPDEAVGQLHLSRIHNDLNLTNVLIRENPDRTPVGVYIIDLARSRSHQPTAFDFARLEVEISLALFATVPTPKPKTKPPPPFDRRPLPGLGRSDRRSLRRSEAGRATGGTPGRSPPPACLPVPSTGSVGLHTRRLFPLPVLHLPVADQGRQGSSTERGGDSRLSRRGGCEPSGAPRHPKRILRQPVRPALGAPTRRAK